MKEDSVVSVGISCKPKMENLFLAKSEIDDYLSENTILGISGVNDLKSCLSMIRELRVKFKKSMFEVKSDMGEDKFVAMCPFCKELLHHTSDYITQANECVKVLRDEAKKAVEREKKADDLAEKIRLAEITRVNEIRLAEIAEKQRLEDKADDLTEKIRLAEITRVNEIRLAEIAEKQRLEDKADEREKKADDLAEKIRFAEITRADEREKKADDLAEKIRLAEIIRAEKLRKEDLELAEKVRRSAGREIRK